MNLAPIITAPPVPSPTIWDSLTKWEQAAALEKYRDWDVQDDWYDSTFDWVREVAKILGIDIDEKHGIGFSGFWSQGDGAHFTGTYQHAPLARLMIRADYPNDLDLHRVADDLHAAQPLPYQVVVTVTHHGNYQHEMLARFDCTCQDADGYEIDPDDADPPVPTWSEDDFAEPLRAFMRWIYDKLEVEYEYLTGDEHLIEVINAFDDDQVAELREDDDD